MLAISLASPRHVRRLALLVFCGSVVLLAATFVIGVEIKGARRWISLPGLSAAALGIPEAVLRRHLRLAAGAEPRRATHAGQFPVDPAGRRRAGAADEAARSRHELVVAAVWAAQLFVAGLPLWVAAFGVIGGAASLVGAYFVFRHVRSRVDRFLDPSSGDNYQVNTALEAFMNGGLFGRGPGEGTVKAQLPDAHADFVFAVAGEEFGLIVCLIILALFAFVTCALSRASKETNLFIMLAATGLGVQFGLQAAINMASTLQLIPPRA